MKNHREERRVKEATLDDDESFGDDVSGNDHSANDSAFGESSDVIAEYLLLLRARAAADASRRKRARGSGNFLEIRRTRGSWRRIPLHAYADDLPMPRCARFPADASFWRPGSARARGVNDRFAMGQAPAMEEYAGMYHALCPEDAAMRAPPEDERGGAVTDTDLSAEARVSRVPDVSRLPCRAAWTARSVCSRGTCAAGTWAWTPTLCTGSCRTRPRRIPAKGWMTRTGRTRASGGARSTRAAGNFDALVDEVERCVLEESTF